MIGIYGGTFDPVHYGHLRTALEVREKLGLDQVRLIPCREPPHRPAPAASAEQRLHLLQLALRGGDPRLVADDRELARPGPSYMVDTLASLREEFPAASLNLIVGADAFRGLERWHRWEALFDLAHVLVMERPGENLLATPDHLPDWVRKRRTADWGRLRQSPAGAIGFVEVTQLAISASEIRQSLATGSDPRYLLPDAVLEHIRSAGLYRGSSE
ncbi:MAG: nicotinate-nucleotide adenylyltransferase [Methylococcaceae bacterium]|nr:nicotinate-nucleotide adenylyltransferase [Methylococcaceae bacterium]